jgi:predicted DNA-binding transcriptional regulator YafY
MFEIVQFLRGATRPRTAQDIADELEVTKRTIYRDIASLQAMRIPIEGEAGIGYIMRPGFELPPIIFDDEEAEAVSVGLKMITRTGDKGLIKAARRAARKLADATPLSETLYSSSWGPQTDDDVILPQFRNAIRQEVKMKLEYRDGSDKPTKRTILPIAIIYYSESVVLAEWCELKNDFRHFRTDRILTYRLMPERFPGEGSKLRLTWAKTHAESL